MPTLPAANFAKDYETRRNLPPASLEPKALTANHGYFGCLGCRFNRFNIGPWLTHDVVQRNAIVNLQLFVLGISQGMLQDLKRTTKGEEQNHEGAVYPVCPMNAAMQHWRLVAVSGLSFWRKCWESPAPQKASPRTISGMLMSLFGSLCNSNIVCVIMLITYCIVSYHIILYYIILYHIILYYIILYYIITLYYFVVYYNITLYYIILYYTILYYLYYTMLFYIIL